MRADIYEVSLPFFQKRKNIEMGCKEEDFVTNTFGFPLASETPEAQVLEQLKSAEEQLMSKWRRSKGKKGSEGWND